MLRLDAVSALAGARPRVHRPRTSDTDKRPIVIAVDGSLRASEVLRERLLLAGSLGVKAHVVRTVSIEGEAHETPRKRTPAEVRDDVVSDAARDARMRVYHLHSDAAAHVLVAAPVTGIWGFVKDVGARLVFVGTHGHGAIEKLLGTTAARLVEEAACDVYVVRCGKGNGT